MRDSTAARRFNLGLISTFAAVALVLSAVGLYGVMSYGVNQRTTEIGIRMAVGAPRRAVLGLFLRQGARLTGLGIVLGLLGAVALTRLLASQLYGVSPHDPLILAGVALTILVVAALACWLPARRATRVDPVTTLRAE
ncbi:MAG TPA: FtsX-like permease family protein [Candidatus Didemnitutus sp.]|nr:FtsX-like permease family protein [Candidatus Didemnitutus sp.]